MKTSLYLRQTITYFVLLIALALFVFPFLLLLFNSFKTNAQIIESPISLPTSIMFDNFTIAYHEMNYLGSFMNSLLITCVSVAAILLFSSMTAHYFVRNRTKTNQLLFFTMIAAMIIPFQAIMIPLVSIYGQKLGWISAQPQLTLIFMYIGFGSSLAVFIYHGFIKSVPAELEEAARIDGCNLRQTFFKVVVPILKPTSVTIGILHVLWIWNDFLLPVLILQNAGKDKLTLPLAVQVFNGTYSSDYEKFLPAVVMIILPILILYLFAQRFIIQGVTQGSIK
ncbi:MULTISPECIES: carbohydrate ABC transporter permease [unclassified Paenibacillus]|uniref:carbohydrate ABC transporter permease n=1 Tax=unclassified Paenibacillus TaxID=185978 RepID=UPI001C10B747|nr:MULTISPECIES: carbohydrate ABC transporter permease [unclassified Paenibacillus]MBU5440924.1 carbohydrate ABC transporter permease [Paenibacillus sp. MSJ-34]CAH0118076.1 Melibiose/raffinose/stachyose import permease protein MelC [Paenibacillus sp. CECT 9249]